MSVFKKVETFNKQVVCVPARPVGHHMEYEEHKWLYEVLLEEAEELQEAYFDGDIIGQVDALIDVLYFAMGGLTRMGIPAEISERIFNIVHEANMRKAGGNKGRGSDLDAVKPESWEGPEALIKKALDGAAKE